MNEKERPEKEGKGEFTELDFSSFLLSMHAQTLINLGEVENPLTSDMSIDLEAAKQGIDIISMLQEKTKGNLSDTEHTLLENILYDLRLKYIEKVSQKEN